MMIDKLRQIILLGLLIFLGITELAFAQGGAASLRGTVTDPSGSVVPSAKVTATQVGTGLARTVSTDTGGNYLIPQLSPADYTLTVEAKGFSSYNQKGITLLADQSVTDNVTLHLGTTTQNVNVQAAAAQVDTTTATLNQVVNQTQMVELPLDGRNAAALAFLVAGTAPAP
ncbi:MAG: carboxypeptidase-like regulatory domain-containing protein, partial [Acidobacteriota bacterium]|nr:carboxypeptidase-like regulatory domain-containing protein [Acidobacteriota bacterium]